MPGMSFWDYGNSFLLEASRAGADLRLEEGDGFRYPSYVQGMFMRACLRACVLTCVAVSPCCSVAVSRVCACHSQCLRVCA